LVVIAYIKSALIEVHIHHNAAVRPLGILDYLLDLLRS